MLRLRELDRFVYNYNKILSKNKSTTWADYPPEGLFTIMMCMDQFKIITLNTYISKNVIGAETRRFEIVGVVTRLSTSNNTWSLILRKIVEKCSWCHTIAIVVMWWSQTLTLWLQSQSQSRSTIQKFGDMIRMCTSAMDNDSFSSMFGKF